MHVSRMSIYVVFYVCAFFLNVYCEEADTFDDVTPSTPELKKIHSFFYMSADENLPSLEEKKNEQSLIYMAQPCSCKELDERNTQEIIFYKRLITILLSNLAVQRIDDRLVGTLNIEASSSQFEYLQNFVNGQGSIREADRILNNAIKQSEYLACHYMAEVSHYFNLFVNKASDYLIYYLSFMKQHWDITVISFTVIGSFMILRRQRWSRSLLIFLMVDVIFVTSFFITWWQLIQEAEIKLMAAQTQFAEMPIACQPHKMSLLDKINEWFSFTNDCEKYYESIMKNPRLQVTPAIALTHFLSATIFQPLKYFGLVVSEFVDNATSKLSYSYKFLVVIALFLTICVFIILIPFFWLGGSINFGIGPFFKFGLKGRKNSKEKEEHIVRIHEDTTSMKKLKDSEQLQITSGRDNDFAGGDAGTDTKHLIKKHKKCKCKNGDGDVECEKKEKDRSRDC